MPRQKVTLTLDADRLQELRLLVGKRSLSSADAVVAYLARLRHLAAVDDSLLKLEREHGPVPPETLEWAARVVDRWATSSTPRRGRSTIADCGTLLRDGPA